MEKQQKWYSSLCGSWKNLIVVLLNAPVLIMLSLSIFLVITSINNTSAELEAILNILLALVTGLLGGLVAKKWDDLTSEQIVSTRADSAVRNLKLLLEQAISVEKRVTQLLDRYSKIDNVNLINIDHITNNYEEIIHIQLLIEKHIVNSIEDWKDLVPKAKIEETFGEMRKQKESITSNLKKLQEFDLQQDENVKDDNKEIETVIQILQEQQTQLNLLASELDLPSSSASMITGGTIPVNQYLDERIPPAFLNLNPFDDEGMKLKRHYLKLDFDEMRENEIHHKRK